MANLIAESQLNFDDAFDFALKTIFNKAIKWNTRKAFTNRWYYYGKPIPFVGKTKAIDIVKEFESRLFIDVKRQTNTYKNHITTS